MNELPTVFNSLDEARAYAWAKSIFSEFFYHVIHSNTGRYFVDTFGGVFSDEQVIETYYKGEIAN